MLVEVRGQLRAVSSISLCGFWGLNSHSLSWWHVPLTCCHLDWCQSVRHRQQACSKVRKVRLALIVPTLMEQLTSWMETDCSLCVPICIRGVRLPSTMQRSSRSAPPCFWLRRLENDTAVPDPASTE